MSKPMELNYVSVRPARSRIRILAAALSWFSCTFVTVAALWQCHMDYQWQRSGAAARAGYSWAPGAVAFAIIAFLVYAIVIGAWVLVWRKGRSSRR